MIRRRLGHAFNVKEHDILLLKVDVEGHEVEALRSGEQLLRSGAVRNVMMELNLAMMKLQRGGLNETRRKTRELVRWMSQELGFMSKCSGWGRWNEQVPMLESTWDSLLTATEQARWRTLDIWFYRMFDERPGAWKSESAVKGPPVLEERIME